MGGGGGGEGGRGEGGEGGGGEGGGGGYVISFLNSFIYDWTIYV